MKRGFKIIVNAGELGIVIGLLISLGFSLGYQSDYLPSSPDFVSQFSNSSEALLVSIIIWFLIGSLFGLSDLIFKLDIWSLLKQTLCHFGVTYLIFLILAIGAGWFTITVQGLVIFTVIFIAIYLAMWLLSRRYYSKSIRAINQKLK